jgi:hypothetical protein
MRQNTYANLVSFHGKVIESLTVRKFERHLLGEILRPGEECYDAARRIWNGMIDPRHPAMIVRCATATDVARSVEFARDNEIALAVRGGGHGLTGDSFCDGGMVIDLSGLKKIELDSSRCVAGADAGITVGDFDLATKAFGLAGVMGECSSVGIAGFTLGGGLGRLMGMYGAACDNLLSVELIDADGKFLRASADENPDLFWAIRGGGGNFGIATSFKYRLHRVGQVLSGTLRYPISDTREVLTFLDEFTTTIPDEMDISLDIGNTGMMTCAPGITMPIICLELSFCGDIEKGKAALRPLRSFRKPIADTIRVMPYYESQRLVDLRPLTNFVSAGGSVAIDGGFIQRIGDEAIDLIVAAIAEAPDLYWLAAEHYMHGAVCGYPSEHTAFALRRPGYCRRVFAAWREPAQAEVATAWVKRVSAALEAFSGGAAYLNYLTQRDSAQGVRASYGSNLERLASLKSKYDPSNFFNSNRNIQPLRSGHALSQKVGADGLRQSFELA